MYPTEYSQDLLPKALRGGTVYSEYRLKGIFIDEQHRPIRQKMRGYRYQAVKNTLNTGIEKRNQFTASGGIIKIFI